MKPIPPNGYRGVIAISTLVLAAIEQTRGRTLAWARFGTEQGAVLIDSAGGLVVSSTNQFTPSGGWFARPRQFRTQLSGVELNVRDKSKEETKLLQ